MFYTSTNVFGHSRFEQGKEGIFLALMFLYEPCNKKDIVPKADPKGLTKLLYHFDQVFSHTSRPKNLTILKFALIQKRIYRPSRRPKIPKS